MAQRGSALPSSGHSQASPVVGTEEFDRGLFTFTARVAGVRFVLAEFEPWPYQGYGGNEKCAAQ